ncbi:uncharacterized protein ACIGJ3_001233 [Trichechus inunguis]
MLKLSACALGSISADAEREERVYLGVWRHTLAVHAIRLYLLTSSDIRHLLALSRAIPSLLTVTPRCRFGLQVMLDSGRLLQTNEDSPLDGFAGSAPASAPFSPAGPDLHLQTHSHSPSGEDVPWDCQLVAVLVPRGPVSDVFKERLDHDAWKVSALNLEIVKGSRLWSR